MAKETKNLSMATYKFWGITPGLHYSESSKSQIININLPRVAKVYFNVEISLYFLN